MTNAKCLHGGRRAEDGDPAAGAAGTARMRAVVGTKWQRPPFAKGGADVLVWNRPKGKEP